MEKASQILAEFKANQPLTEENMIERLKNMTYLSLTLPKDLKPKSTIKITSNLQDGRTNTFTTDVKELYDNIIQIDYTLKNQKLCLNKCPGYKDCKIGRMFPIMYREENGNLYFAHAFCNKREAYLKEREKAKYIQNSRVPLMFQGALFDAFTPRSGNKEALAAAKQFVQKMRKKGLFIFGDKGVGKTMLLSIIANELAEKMQNVLYVCAPELAIDFKRAMKAEDPFAPLEYVKKVPCLIIDDLGAERETEWLCEQMFILFNYRYNFQLPTVISSNLDPKELPAHFQVSPNMGGRIVSRMGSMMDFYRITGASGRLRKR